MRSIPAIAIILLGILLIISQYLGNILIMSCLLILWILLIGIFYNKVLHKIGKPKFWIFSILITLTSGILLGPKDKGFLFYGIHLSLEGLEAGTIMLMRAITLFIFIQWIITNISIQKIYNFFSSKKAGNLGVSISVALMLLPELKEKIKLKKSESDKTWLGFNKLKIAFIQLLVETAFIAEELSSTDIDHHKACN